MRVPDEIRLKLRSNLWQLADQLDWARLSWAEKSHYYEIWTRDPVIGGRLANYMDERRVRVYIKDTIMKGYVRERMADPVAVMRVLGLDDFQGQVLEEYQRPHGRRLSDGRIIAWARAKEWKAVFMALHERAYYVKEARPYGAVLFSASGKFDEDYSKNMIRAAADRLGIEKLVWLK